METVEMNPNLVLPVGTRIVTRVEVKTDAARALRPVGAVAEIVAVPADEYDFGDSWRHVIEFENMAVVPEAGLRYPVCTGGARSRPPEDCGGTSGYEELLEVLADPRHEEQASMKKWVGKKFAGELRSRGREPSLAEDRQRIGAA